MMKRYLILSVFTLMTVLLYGQQTDYEKRYELLVSKLGPSGVGVETVLDNWSKVDSTNVKLLEARFNYYFHKAQTQEVVKKPQNNYLGMKPLLSLKDTSGVDIYYYQETFFDDEIYGRALKEADRAISFYRDNLDFRFMKANAYIAYEKESPDMALAYLTALADEVASMAREWKYSGNKVEEGFFADAMQEYCYTFYSIGSEDAMEVFLSLSKKMLSLYPANVGYMNNIGSYYMVAKKDYKAALNQYGKVLKKSPEDYIAIKNSLIAARKLKNTKLEKKFLKMVVKYGPENERQQAEIRLKALEKK